MPAAIRLSTAWLDGGVAAGKVAGGEEFTLHVLDGERALLVGWDVEDNETSFGRAWEEMADIESDLLAGAPGWWTDIVHNHPGAVGYDAEFERVNLVFGWDGRCWTKVLGAPPPDLVRQFVGLHGD